MDSLLSKIGFIVLSFIMAVGYAAERHKTEVHVGIYAPFSNENSFIGRTILGTLESAREQLNSAEINYSFYTLDQLPNNSAAKKTVNKFIDTHHINVMLTEGTANGLFVAPIAKQRNIIHFSLASHSQIADGVYNFLAWSPAFEKDIARMKQLKNKQLQHIDAHNLALAQRIVQHLQNDSPLLPLFSLLNQSVVLTSNHYSRESVSAQIHALTRGTNLGDLNLDNNGILYSKADIKKLKNGVATV